ncbi:MAG: hypothetical protein Q9M89_05000 [Persephonella sp.]|nr:hypothetical protein [Persephonella sp.]
MLFFGKKRQKTEEKEFFTEERISEKREEYKSEENINSLLDNIDAGIVVLFPDRKVYTDRKAREVMESINIEVDKLHEIAEDKNVLEVNNRYYQITEKKEDGTVIYHFNEITLTKKLIEDVVLCSC